MERLSGSAKRKIKKEKEVRNAENLKHIPKIGTFFNAVTITNCSAKAASVDEEANVSNSSLPAEEEADAAPHSLDIETPPSASSSSDDSPAVVPASAASSTTEGNNDDDGSPVSPPPSVGTASTPTLPGDPALWPPITEQLREEALYRGPAAFHNRACKYPASVRESGLGSWTRSLTNDLLHCRLQNNQIVPREWLLYSPSTGSIYCYSCKLLSSQRHAFISGFCDWKHPERISDHEKSAEHRQNMLSLLHRSKHACRVDASLARQCEAEQHYWKEVLRRVVAVIQFLGARGLPFRGDNELLGSAHNGNYLGLLELIAAFDPFLKQHLEKYGNKGRGKPSYLSSTVCEEFISLMGEKTKQVIAEEIRQAKYFSVIVDSTPDLAHVDQLTFVFRFVSEDGRVVERFIGFEPIHSHTGISLAESVIEMVRGLGLDLSNCRGQSYDNASNMSGKYSGLQAHLKKQNPLIHYTPCAAHSLNLVGVNSIDNCCEEVNSFFELLQSLYTFSSASTHRWHTVFQNNEHHISHTLKSLSTTRWSCRAESTKALNENYGAIRCTLAKIASDCDEKTQTKCEATALVAKLDKLETVIMSMLWNRVLQRFKATSDQLQKSDMDLATAVRLLRSLHSYVGTLRDQFAELEQSARSVSATQSYQFDTRRARKRKRFADESDDSEVAFTDSSRRFEVETYYVIIDRLSSCLSRRIEAYTDVCDLFGVLFERDCDDCDVRDRAAKLSSTYATDLDSSLGDELIQFKHFVQSENSPAELLQALERNGLKTTFPNVYVALRLFLTLPVSNCEGERSFSVLKRVKNELRTTMSQPRLTALSLMSIEHELVSDLDFEDVVHQFAHSKSRKKPV